MGGQAGAQGHARRGARAGTSPRAGLLTGGWGWRRQARAERPPRAELDRLRPGDLVGLGWAPRRGDSSRLWVEILDNVGRQWIGRVETECPGVPGPERDSLVEFDRDDVRDVWFTQIVETAEHAPRRARRHSLVTVAFALEDGTVERELLWAQPRTEGTYRIDSVPFFVAGIGLGDVVSADTDAAGTLWATGLSERAGAATLRAAVDPEVVEDPARATVDLARRLARGRVQVEVSEDTGIIALALPQDAEVLQVVGTLEELRRSGAGCWEVSSAPEWWSATPRPV